MENRKIDLEEALKEGKPIQIAPKGNSMYPFLIEGRDEVILQKVPDEELKRGDVVLYRSDRGILVLHRIWKKKAGTYYMMGDNQMEAEGPIKKQQIYGKMIRFVQSGKERSVFQMKYWILSRMWMFLYPIRRQYRRWKKR